MIAIAALATFASAPARAQSEDDLGDADPDAVGAADDAGRLDEGPAARFGLGVRARYVFFPKGLLELFVDSASSGVSRTGFGVEFVRRKANFDLVVGLEYDNVSPEDGLWLEKGDTPGVPGENPDFVEFDGLATLGLDVAFVWHHPLASRVSLRYGAGIGVAAVLGDVIQTDTRCTVQGDINSCSPDPNGEQVNEKSEDVPPAVPIVNLLLGARIDVAPQLSLNIETGFRDVFYAGLGTTYMF
ncbi:MAG: hypothetical protein D6689_01060 [Deltaproteobacteria bacterium]|nr:MAG: hypothetical protein D6689_01060 [Deltaproteobacteria bacterium]